MIGIETVESIQFKIDTTHAVNCNALNIPSTNSQASMFIMVAISPWLYLTRKFKFHSGVIVSYKELVVVVVVVV